jgi:HEAT repeat protein
MARTLLGSMRGAHGLATLQQLYAHEPFADSRRQLVNAVGQSSQPAAVALLRTIAKQDRDPKVRGEAAYWLPQRGGAAVVPETLGLIDTDSSDQVKQRAVEGLSRLTDAGSTARLITLARTHTDLAVRRTAVNALSRSKDPAALAYLTSLIK